MRALEYAHGAVKKREELGARERLENSGSESTHAAHAARVILLAGICFPRDRHVPAVYAAVPDKKHSVELHRR